MDDPFWTAFFSWIDATTPLTSIKSPVVGSPVVVPPKTNNNVITPQKKGNCHRFHYFWMCAGLDIYKGIITNQPHRSGSFDLVSLFLTSDLGTQSHSPALVSCSPFPVTTVVTFVIIQSKTRLFKKNFDWTKPLIKKYRIFEQNVDTLIIYAKVLW